MQWAEELVVGGTEKVNGTLSRLESTEWRIVQNRLIRLVNFLLHLAVESKVKRPLRYFSSSLARDVVKVQFAGATP